MDDEQRRRWIDSLSEDEQILLHVPPGYRFAFITAALTKRALATDGIKVGDRLHLLEKLNGLTDRYFTADILAMSEPMSNLEFEIFREARSLDADGDKSGIASFKVLTSHRVF